MWTRIVYVKTDHRMPVRLRPCPFPGDIRQDLPAGWCPGCGAELYSAGQTLCRRCKGGAENESKSLYDLQPGEMPG